GTHRAQGRNGVRSRNVLPGEGRHLCGADRGRGDSHAERAEGDLSLPGTGAADRQPLLAVSASLALDTLRAGKVFLTSDELTPPVERAPLRVAANPAKT